MSGSQAEKGLATLRDRCHRPWKIFAAADVLSATGHERGGTGMGNEDEARKQAEEDTSEDLELRDEDAGNVTGGAINKLSTQVDALHEGFK
jgi:hypothetical protein